LAIGFLHRLRPTTEVVAQFVGREITRLQPRASFESDDFESGLGERQYRHAARGAKPDDHDIGGRQVNGHWVSSSRTSRSRKPTCASAPVTRPFADRWRWRSV